MDAKGTSEIMNGQTSRKGPGPQKIDFDKFWCTMCKELHKGHPFLCRLPCKICRSVGHPGKYCHLKRRRVNPRVDKGESAPRLFSAYCSRCGSPPHRLKHCILRSMNPSTWRRYMRQIPKKSPTTSKQHMKQNRKMNLVGLTTHKNWINPVRRGMNVLINNL